MRYPPKVIGRIFFWSGLVIANLVVIAVRDVQFVGVWPFFLWLLRIRLLIAAIGALILFLPLAFLWPLSEQKLGLDVGKPWWPRLLLAGALMANPLWAALGLR